MTYSLYLQYMWVMKHFPATAPQTVVSLMTPSARFKQQQF